MYLGDLAFVLVHWILFAKSSDGRVLIRVQREVNDANNCGEEECRANEEVGGYSIDDERCHHEASFYQGDDLFGPEVGLGRFYFFLTQSLEHWGHCRQDGNEHLHYLELASLKLSFLWSLSFSGVSLFCKEIKWPKESNAGQ